MSDVWHSPDGVNWTCATDSARWPARYGHTSVIFDNKIWVLGGATTYAGEDNDVWYYVSDSPLPNLPEGWMDWHVTAFDKAGNRRLSNQTFSVRIDTTGPDTFSLSYPMNNETTFVLQPCLYWRRASDAGSGIKKYQLWINDVINQDSVPATDTSATPVSPLPNGSFNTWFVKAFDRVGNVRPSNDTWSFTVWRYDSIPPSVPVLIAPANGSYILDTLPRFWWHRSTDDTSGIDYYTLQYAQNPSFVGGITVDIYDTTYQVFSRLYDTTYYWRVKAVDRCANRSDWSSVWRFEIDTRVPTTPSLVEPIGGVWCNRVNVIFRWTQIRFGKGNSEFVLFVDDLQAQEQTPQIAALTKTIPSANKSDLPKSNFSEHIKISSEDISGSHILDSPVRYIIQIDTNQNFLEPLVVDTTINIQDTINLTEGRYYWRVMAYDLAGNQGEFSNPDSFGVDISPSTIPVLIAPPNDTMIQDTLVNFIWHCSQDTTSGISNYQLQVSLSPNFINLIIDTVSPDTFGRFGLPETIYYWRVKSSDYAGNQSDWSSVWNFRLYLRPGIEEENLVIPIDFKLNDVYPNPFKTGVGIMYTLPKSTAVRICIYDISGNMIKRLISGIHEAGIYRVKWDGKDANGKNCPAGIYFYRLESEEYKMTKKMMKME